MSGELILPKVPTAIMGRPKKVDPSVIDEFTAEQLVVRLATAGGDITEFCNSFHATDSTHQKLIARALFKLNEVGSEKELQKWQLLIQCHRQAVTQIKEREALDTIKDMTMPLGADIPFKDKVPFLNFWLSDYKEGAKTRTKQALAQPEDATTAAVAKMLENMKKFSSATADEEDGG